MTEDNYLDVNPDHSDQPLQSAWEKDMLAYLTHGGPTYYSENGRIHLHVDFVDFTQRYFTKARAEGAAQERERIEAANSKSANSTK